MKPTGSARDFHRQIVCALWPELVLFLPCLVMGR
jgi:hypothetical protein